MATAPMSWPAAALQFSFNLQLCGVLKAIITGKSADQLATLPIVENATDVLAGDAGHRGKVALPDFLVNDSAAGADILAKILCQFENVSDAPTQRQKTNSRHRGIGLRSRPAIRVTSDL